MRKIETALQKDSMDYYAFQKYGYNLNNTFTSSDRKLYLYHRTISRHYHNLITCGRTTLTCKSMSNLFKSVNRVINTMSCHKNDPPIQTIDSSGLATWVALNPDKVSKERWESCICGMIPKYTIGVKNFKELCDLIVELQLELTNCDIQAQITSTPINCDIEPKLLLELQKCGLSVPVINKAINCGLTFRYIDGELGFTGVNGVKLTFEDITNLDTGCLV